MCCVRAFFGDCVLVFDATGTPKISEEVSSHIINPNFPWSYYNLKVARSVEGSRFGFYNSN